MSQQSEAKQELVLADLADDELVEQMFDDLYDGLADEIAEATRILLGRGWDAKRVLDEARRRLP
jgi:5-methyltetrahydrofolate--homocysteine methyltransferase